ncbi:hypothetical protein GCM10018779_21950 [Streptomyces griseocarneus]|nr:hypothetical protein GCM10018779_21950 [Streptomyces griseocarneus]
MGTRAVRAPPAAPPLSVPPSVAMACLPDSDDPAAVTGSSVYSGHMVARAEPEGPGDTRVDLEVSVR